MIKNFGKPFKYYFYPVTADCCDYEQLEITPLWIQIYESYPNRDDIINSVSGTNNNFILPTAITTWVDTNDFKGKCFDVPAISDPDPSSDHNIDKKYYLAIKCLLTGSTDEHIIIREITLTRLYGHHSILDNINVSDVIDYDPTLENEICACVGDIEPFIKRSISSLKAEISSCCNKSCRIWDSKALKEVVIRKTLAEVYLHHSRVPDDNIGFWV